MADCLEIGFVLLGSPIRLISILAVFRVFLNDHWLFGHHIRVPAIFWSSFINNSQKRLRCQILFLLLNRNDPFDLRQFENWQLLASNLLRLLFIHPLDVLKRKVKRHFWDRYAASFMTYLLARWVLCLLLVLRHEFNARCCVVNWSAKLRPSNAFRLLALLVLRISRGIICLKKLVALRSFHSGMGR